MGRFYHTTKATFVPNSIYTPPIELMQKAIALNEQRVDKALAETNLFQNAVDTIKHINSPSQNALVKQLQEKYTTPINDIVQKIHENPLDYQKYLPEMRKMQRDMLTDKQSGIWNTLEQNHALYKTWLKDNESKKTSDPATYNMMNAYWKNKLENDSKVNPNALFQGAQVISRPDVMKKLTGIIKNIKANSTGMTTDGKYIYQGKAIDKNRIENIAWNMLRSDPKFQGYSYQMGKLLGQKGYYDESGNTLNPFVLVDEQGEPISNEDYDKLSDAEKKKVTQEVNPNSAFYPDLVAAGNAFSYENQTSKVNPFGFKRDSVYWDTQEKLALQRGKFEYAVQLATMKGNRATQDAKDKLLNKLYYDGYVKNNAEARKAYEKFVAKTSVGTVNSPVRTTTNDEALLEKFIKSPNTLAIDPKYGGGKPIPEYGGKTSPDEGKGYMYVDQVTGEGHTTARMGTAEFAAQQRLVNASNSANAKIGKQIVSLSDGTTFPTSAYIAFLGGRKSTDATAERFLERKQYFLKEGVFKNPDYNPQKFAEDSARTANMLNKNEYSPENKDELIKNEEDYFAKKNNLYGAINSSANIEDRRKAQENQNINNLNQPTKAPENDYYKNLDIIKDVGKQIENLKDEWYKNNTGVQQQLSFQPITDPGSSMGIAKEIMKNPQNFNLVDKKGETVSKERKLMGKIDINTPISVSSANASGQITIRIPIDGEVYYAIPNVGNDAENSTIIKVAAQGMDSDSQTYKNLSDIFANNLINKIYQTGKDTNGVRKARLNIHGVDANLEIGADGNSITFSNIDGSIVKHYNSIYEFTEAFLKALNN